MRNKILSICDDSGTRLDDPQDVKMEVLRFYKNMLGTKFNQKRFSGTRLRFTNIVPSTFHFSLIPPVTPEEIRKAIFAINGDKAPGLDGFNASFFHRNWPLVGKEVTAAILHFFNSGVMLRDVNATALTHTPKTSCPQSMREYRAIACCNVIYKAITKIFATRLQPIFPDIINKAQATFVEDRSISNNIY